MRRGEFYKDAFDEKNPEGSLGLLIHTARLVGALGSFYKDGKLANFPFLLGGVVGSDGGTINGAINEPYQQGEYIHYSAQGGLSLHTTGIFGVAHYYDDFTAPGNSGTIAIWGLVSYLKWAYIVLGAKSVRTQWGTRLVITKIRMRRVTLRELVNLCDPEKIWRGLHKYVADIHHWEKQKFDQLDQVMQEFSDDCKMLQEEDLREADWT